MSELKIEWNFTGCKAMQAMHDILHLGQAIQLLDKFHYHLESQYTIKKGGLQCSSKIFKYIIQLK